MSWEWLFQEFSSFHLISRGVFQCFFRENSWRVGDQQARQAVLGGAGGQGVTDEDLEEQLYKTIGPKDTAEGGWVTLETSKKIISLNPIVPLFLGKD